MLLLTLRHRIAGRPGTCRPSYAVEGWIVLATHQGLTKKNWKENIVDRFINWFHMVFKWVNNCTPKICKFGFVALREGDIGGVGLSLYDLSQQLDVFLPPWTFPLHYWSLYSWDSMTASRSRWPSVVILTSSPNTSSASFARSCVFTTRALVPANFWSHWQGSPISSFLD